MLPGQFRRFLILEIQKYSKSFLKILGFSVFTQRWMFASNILIFAAQNQRKRWKLPARKTHTHTPTIFRKTPRKYQTQTPRRRSQLVQIHQAWEWPRLVMSRCKITQNTWNSRNCPGEWIQWVSSAKYGLFQVSSDHFRLFMGELHEAVPCCSMLHPVPFAMQLPRVFWWLPWAPLGSPGGHCHRQKPWEAEQRALTEGHLLYPCDREEWTKDSWMMLDENCRE